MKIKDLFTIQIKAPMLDEQEAGIYNTKKILKVRIDTGYERLESVEILNSNSKYHDAILVSKDLLLYLINTLCVMNGKQEVSSLENFFSSVTAYTPDNFLPLFEDKTKILEALNAQVPDSEATDLLETFLSNLLYTIEKRVKSMDTLIDKHYKRLKFQSFFLIIVLAIFVYIPVSVYQKNKVHPDKMQVFLMNAESPNTTEDKSVSVPLKIHDGWETYTLVLPQSTSISQIRIDPFNQNNLKIQIEFIRFLNSKKEIIKERNFIVQPNFMLNDQTQIFNINQFLPSKDNKAGNIAEMYSNGSDPYFYLNMGDMQDVASIEIKLRFTKVHKKFSN
jgi:hypothetical protein